MSSISIPTSMASDKVSSNFAICSETPGKQNYEDNTTNPNNNHNTYPNIILTESVKSVISLSDERLNNLLTKLNVAKVHITPLVDIILQAASACSETEFKDLIRNNKPVCCVPNNQYIRAISAAQILYDVNTELLQHQKPSSAIYSMNTKKSFFVNPAIEDVLNSSKLATNDTIYIDRETMKQLLELHELVTETINKLQKAELNKTEALQIGYKDTKQSVRNVNSKICNQCKNLPQKTLKETTSSQDQCCCSKLLEGYTWNCIGNKNEIKKDQRSDKEPEISISNKSLKDINNSNNKGVGNPKNIDKNKLNSMSKKRNIPKDQQKEIGAQIITSKEEEHDKPVASNPLASQLPNEVEVTENVFTPKENTKSKKITKPPPAGISPSEELPKKSKVGKPRMLPNERQLSITPSDTVIRDFGNMSFENKEKRRSPRSSISKGTNSNIDKTIETPKKKSRSDSTDKENQSAIKKAKLNKKKSPIDIKPIEADKLSNKQKKEKADQFEEPIPLERVVDSNSKNKNESTVSIKGKPIDADNTNKNNPETLQKQMDASDGKIQEKAKRAGIKTKKKDNKMSDIENVDHKTLPNELIQQGENKKSGPNKKLKDKKSSRKVQEPTEKDVMADSVFPAVSEAAGEIITSTPKQTNKEIKDRETAKNKSKNDKKMKKIAKVNDNLDKEKQNDYKKNESFKDLKNSKENEAVNTIGDLYPSQPPATVMQAPSIHTQNKDNKQFFQTQKTIATLRNIENTNTNTDSDTEITSNQIILSTTNEGIDDRKDEVNQKVSDNITKYPTMNVINRKRNQLNDVGQKLDKTPIAHHNSANSAVNHETVMNTGDEVMEQIEEKQPQPKSVFQRAEKNKLPKPSELSNNAKIMNQSANIVKQNQLQNKPIDIRENEHQSSDISDNVQTSLIQRTKTISKELFSTIRREKTSNCHCNINSFSQNTSNKDKYNNTTDAKVALLQCLKELTKIRKYINICDDPELRVLEESVNINIIQHDKNCGMDDAPHIHCNLQGIELTLKTDKNLYAENIVTNQANVSSTAKASLLVKPINSNNNTAVDTYSKTTNGKQTQTSASDPAISLLNRRNAIQTDHATKDLILPPADDTKMSEQYQHKELFPQYHEFDPKFVSSLIQSTKPSRIGATTKKKDFAKSIENHVSSTGIPYVVGIKSLPKVDGDINTSESMIISVDSMKNILDTEVLYHKNESVNKAINSIHINHLLLSCTPVNCSIKTCLNDRRDFPDLPLKPSLTSLPLSATDLVVIRQNIERKSNIPMNDNLRESNCNHNTFEYYTNFQANFSSNRKYFVPRVYLVYYFEIHRYDESGDNDRSDKRPSKKRTHLTATTTQQQQEEDLDTEPDRKWSDFKIFDYLRKEFMLLRGDGLSPKTSNAINVRTSNGRHNKKIQVSLTKTIAIPIKSRRISSRNFDVMESTKRPAKSYIATTATQTFSYCKIKDTRIDQEITQKQRTLHTQTTTHSSSTKSLANILLDTIYETDLETCLQKPVQHIYNLSEIIHTPSSRLEELRNIPKEAPKEFIIETSQYEINTTAKPNISMISNTNLTCSKELNDYKHIYPSFIPRRTIDDAKDKLDAKRNIAGPGNMTGHIGKRSANRYNRIEKKQCSNSTYMSPKTSALHKSSPLTDSSSDCDDVLPVPSKPFVPTSSSNLSQSKLISSSPKRQNPKSKHNIVRDKIKNLPVYNSESLGATLNRYQPFASSELDQYPSQVKFGSRSENNTSVASSVFNLPKKHSCGFLSVLSPSCGCPDVTVFIPCFCNEKGCKNKKNSESLDILNKGVSGMYHVIMPPVNNTKSNN